MKSLIRYKTKPEFAAENQRLVEKVYEELGARDPGGVTTPRCGWQTE